MIRTKRKKNTLISTPEVHGWESWWRYKKRERENSFRSNRMRSVFFSCLKLSFVPFNIWFSFSFWNILFWFIPKEWKKKRRESQSRIQDIHHDSSFSSLPFFFSSALEIRGEKKREIVKEERRSEMEHPTTDSFSQTTISSDFSVSSPSDDARRRTWNSTCSCITSSPFRRRKCQDRKGESYEMRFFFLSS